MVQRSNISYKEYYGDFPHGPAIKNPPSSAEDAGSVSGWGSKSPQAVKKPSPCPTAEVQAPNNNAAKTPRATTMTQGNQINKHMK